MALRHEYIITWAIENYSFCYQRTGESLLSSEFYTDELGGTSWFLDVYPRGHAHEDNRFISIFLNRVTTDDGPKYLTLTYQFSFLGADGSILYSKGAKCFTFQKAEGCGISKFIDREVVLGLRKSIFLPHDTLTISCKMWQQKEQIQMSTQIYARTRIGVENLSFMHTMENFSTRKPCEYNCFKIRSNQETYFLLQSRLYISDCSTCYEKLMVETELKDENHILSKCEIYLLDSSGALVKCGKADNRFDVLRQDICKLHLTLTRDAILNRKRDYLPNDKLSLFCDFMFATGVEYEKIETILHKIPSTFVDQINTKDQNKDTYEVLGKLSECSTELDDFKSVYDSQLHTDVLLKTKRKTFFAHKVVLSARSSVFKAMLNNDMREKYTDCILIDDLEDDTVEKFLIFLYSDSLENLHWGSAVQLYYAADKYEIERLKVLCSSFLVNNLTASYATELLILADTHNDSDLLDTVQNFIFKNEKEVFSSREWGNLSDTNPQLFSKTMLLKYKT